MNASQVRIYEKEYLIGNQGNASQKVTVVEIGINIIPCLNLIRPTKRKEHTRSKIVGANLPPYVLNADPAIPTMKFMIMLLQMRHEFAYMGQKLDYNGWSTKTGLPEFCLIKTGKTFRKPPRVVSLGSLYSPFFQTLTLR